jgi:hypothetical protein
MIFSKMEQGSAFTWMAKIVAVLFADAVDCHQPALPLGCYNGRNAAADL